MTEASLGIFQKNIYYFISFLIPNKSTTDLADIELIYQKVQLP